MFMHVREKPKVYRNIINWEEISPETYRKLFCFDKGKSYPYSINLPHERSGKFCTAMSGSSLHIEDTIQVPPLFCESCSHQRDVAIVKTASNCLLKASKRFEHKQKVMHTKLSNCLGLIFCLASNCLCFKQLLASNCYFLCIWPNVMNEI